MAVPFAVNLEDRAMLALENEPIVAFTLAHYPARAGLFALPYLAFDRLSLGSTPGLRFYRLLGVGKGKSFDPHADFQRYALFTVWDSHAALQRFEAQSSMMQRIRQRANELWSVHMLPVRSHGLWGGCDPFSGITPVDPPEPGPWVILTRATIYPSQWRTFLKAVPAVTEQLLQQQELIASVGVGEAPIFFQGTISLWRSLAAITTFAYSPAQHSVVIRRTRREHWYREELFARFRPVASWGTWDGVDPLKMSFK
jgi:heme-degrading monooxygenase HmoA